jgi:hypothetical protein
MSSSRHCTSLVAVAMVTLMNLGFTFHFFPPQAHVSHWNETPVEERLVHRGQDEKKEVVEFKALFDVELSLPMVDPKENKESEPQRNITSISVVGRTGMHRLLSRYLSGGNLFCEMIDPLRIADPTVFVQFNITFGCQELFTKVGGGTGNYLGLLYGMRLAAEVYGDVELHFTCHDAESTRNRLILPWLTGVYPARSLQQPSIFPNLTLKEACGGANQQPVGYMVQAMQRDFRYMAVSLVGQSFTPEGFNLTGDSYVPSFVPQFSSAKASTPPPYASVELDEAVTHFRCGDLIDSRHSSFSFMNFRGYTRHIHPNAHSIGILTQPFANGTVHARQMDVTQHTRDRCRIVVHAFQEYIQERFPQARVRIHNEESIALTYVRMIMAQQVISGITTFSVMPAVATFGTGYIRVPDRPEEVNQWVLNPRIDTIVDNVVLTEDPKMPVRGVKILWRQKGEPGVLNWFRNDAWTGKN